MKLIPNVLGNECKSNAERKVFKYLKETSFDEGYAFHSVGLPEHEKKSYSEADFIVVTKFGVLCLEVKGGQVDCTNGVWEFTDRFGKKSVKNEGPFDQAAGALFALKTALRKQFYWAKNISFASGVVFPDITFSYRGVSIIPEILYDFSSTFSFDEYIKKCHVYWDDRNRREFSFLTNEEIDQIKKFIRDDLHFVPAVSSVINSVDEQLIRLTEEQIKVLYALEENEKLLINGPAGSGKTLIAMQYARNCVEKGKRVLFLTYNKMLATFLSKNNVSDRLFIKHFHGLISDYIAIEPNRVSDANYYSTHLPEQLLKYLSSHKTMQYDVLIVDEGQDLLNTKYFPIFDKLLKKGLYNGNWMFFYDSNQNLFNRKRFDKAMEALQRYYPIKYKLTKNCRNTEPIALFNKHISGIESGNAIVGGENVNIISCDAIGFDNELDGLISTLIKSGVKQSEIVVLSPVLFENSVIAGYEGIYKALITKFSGDFNICNINYATVQAYKGLDSKVVIAVDIHKENLEDKSILLYTLLSRARTLLYILSDGETEKELKYKVLMNL